jgi:ABC-type bacteriocin/lantibiotic exporter with double-glycine peptidase domain
LLLESNKIIGITGKSGSGKSTFCDILMGLLDYQEGSIKINGNILAIYENKEWFNKISYAPPQTKLINDSVLNNIFFSSEDVYSFEHIQNIVNLDFLESEDSLEELPTANTLSAGQVQRLGLARSIARRFPELIILDEPTSALDNENMANFIKNLTELKQDKMIILITHEINILKEVDQVIVFNDGYADSFTSFAEALDQSGELNRLIQANQ